MTAHELMPRNALGGVATSASTRPKVGARSTADTTFDGDACSWDDLPPETLDALGSRHDLARFVTTDRTTAVLLAGHKHQAMHAWQASAAGVGVARALRRLAPLDGGRLRPVGAWQHDRASHHLTSRPPTHRRGTVPASISDRPVASAAPTTTPPPRPHAQRAAAAAWGYLPAVVRSGAEGAVPRPDVWLGGLVQWSTDEGFGYRQRLTVLRLDAAAAVVIEARREIEAVRSGDADRVASRLAATSWDVAQWSYVLLDSVEAARPFLRA